MHVGKHIGMKPGQLWELYYTLLLKDLGCSSNAARISELYLADDHRFKRDFKQVDRGVIPALKFVMISDVDRVTLMEHVDRECTASLRLLREIEASA